jgi:glycerol-3-phosphate acyltransferase PlsY
VDSLTADQVYARRLMRIPRHVRRLGLAVGLGYLLGTFPTADLVARRAAGDVDLRVAGTGNPGAANALKVLGPRAGAAVMAGDIAKGAAACGVGALVAGPAGAHLAGTASVTGHCYPVWTGFRGGGKGVAASVGQCLATFPAYFLIDAAVAGVTASNPKWKQRAFAATLASSACWVIGAVVWWAKGWSNLWGPKPSALLPLAAAASSTIIAQRFLAAGPPTPDPESTESAVPDDAA